MVLTLPLDRTHLNLVNEIGFKVSPWREPVSGRDLDPDRLVFNQGEKVKCNSGQVYRKQGDESAGRINSIPLR